MTPDIVFGAPQQGTPRDNGDAAKLPLSQLFLVGGVQHFGVEIDGRADVLHTFKYAIERLFIQFKPSRRKEQHLRPHWARCVSARIFAPLVIAS